MMSKVPTAPEIPSAMNVVFRLGDGDVLCCRVLGDTRAIELSLTTTELGTIVTGVVLDCGEERTLVFDIVDVLLSVVTGGGTEEGSGSGEGSGLLELVVDVVVLERS